MQATIELPDDIAGGLGLKDAKACTDQVLEGSSVSIAVTDWNAAVQLAEALQALGAEARPAPADSSDGEPATAPDAAPDAPRR